MIIYDINPPRNIKKTVIRPKRKPATFHQPKTSFNILSKIFDTFLIFSLAGFLSLFPPSKVFAATGDITAVRIASAIAYSGWTAEIDIDGLSTGGTYDFGLGANNDPTNAKMVFTVTSQGYDDSGNATTMTRTVYGTNYVRKVYPDNAQAYETDNGGSVTVRVALSDYIYSSDTVTVTIASSFYTQGTANNSVTNLAVTNSSVESYPKVIANWSWPGYDRITGSTLKLRAVAFHRSAQEGRPVRAVKYTCTDQHSNTATDTVTTPSIDGTISDAVPVVEYVGTISTASLTQGDALTCNFIAYPWYGDAGSILNTGDGVNTMPTPLYAPQTYLLDKDNTYGVTVAVVDSVSGDNATGAAVDYAAFDSENPPAAFLNIFAAANAIAAYNNTNHSRNNTGAGIIYLKEGSHVWTGGTVTAGGQATSPSWVTVTKFPGTTRSNVLISTAATTKQVNEKLKLEDVKVTNSTVSGFTGMDTVWVHNSDIAPTGAATFYVNTVLYITNSQIWNSAELKEYSTVNASRALVRGNSTMENFANAAKPYTFIGNSFDTQALGIQGDTPGQTTPAFTNTIYAYNIINQFSATSQIIGSLNLTSANTHGIAVVQNVFERASGTAPPISIIASDQSTADPVNNVLIWNNSLIGQRLNMAYNDYNLNDVGPVYRKSWSVKNNIFDDYNSVTDIDSHGGTPDNDRYGNHSVIHGAGFSGNVFLERTGASGYNNKFSGLNSVLGSSLNPQYVDDNSAVGDGTGNGDYHLTASSPALSLVSSGQALLLYDIAGNLRHNNGYGAAGAYEWDVTAPTVTGFSIPTTASSLTVTIDTFTATDAVGVTGYKLTESSTAPAYDAASWSGTAQTEYVFATEGAKTLYAWAKDAVGNVSASASDTVTITLPTYTIGGTTSGLTGTVVLQNNGGDNESVSTGSFTFDAALADSAAYAVTVLTQPSGQTCVVSNGSGTVASANVTNVSVSCSNDDSTAPVRSAGSPSGSQSAGTTQVTLSLTTNENATCKYSTSAGTAYSSMTDTFSTTAGTSHSSTITGLSNGNSYNYYVRCTDGSNANSDDYTISFSVTSPSSSGGGGGSPAMWTLPTVPSGGFKVYINGGALTTSNRNVSLNFNAGTDIKKMAISMIGDFTDASQEDYIISKQWDLCSKFGGSIKNPTCPDGTYTVYVKFYTAYGRSSNNAFASSTIMLKANTATGENLQQTTNLPFTKTLSYKQTDADVKRLQIFLNSYPDTKLADTGVGSQGKETNYFGPLTKKAVIKFQEKYAKDILSPWGLIKGTGFVGKTTLAKINELIGKIIGR